MIIISNGLLPDLDELEGGQKNTPAEPVVSFSYDNSLDEIDGAMKTFQTQYASKRGLVSIIAYGLLTCAVVAAIILNPTSVFAYAALLFCGFGFAYSITDKKRARKKTLEALKDMNPEEYTATIYPDRIELETIIKPKTNEVNLKIDENADEEIISPLKSVFRFDEDLLNFTENDESLLLVFNRRQIYCFPKRCLTSEQEEKTRDFLTEKLESN